MDDFMISDKEEFLNNLIDNASNCHVEPSVIHGYGLFASKDFKWGELVVDYSIQFERWRYLKFEELTEEQIEREWFVGVTEDTCITSDDYSKFSFLNHSRDANCICDFTKFLINANREIKKGEEITIDYRTEPRSPTIPVKKWF